MTKRNADSQPTQWYGPVSFLPAVGAAVEWLVELTAVHQAPAAIGTAYCFVHGHDVDPRHCQGSAGHAGGRAQLAWLPRAGPANLFNLCTLCAPGDAEQAEDDVRCWTRFTVKGMANVL